MQGARNQDVVWTNDTAYIISMFCKLLIFIMFIYPFAHYSLFVSHENVTSVDEANSTATAANNMSELVILKVNKTVVMRPVVQPHCTTAYLQKILKGLLDELYVKKEMCTPEDVDNLEKHKIVRYPVRNNKTTKPRGTVVIYIAVALLVISVGAAFVDVYKAKKQQVGGKTKPPLTRKCSLADLTVERHNRKELIRKDSILEEPEPQGCTKPLGNQPLPLHRRCSFPVAPGEFSCGRLGRASYDYGVVYPDSRPGSRRTSVDNDSSAEQRHVRILRRH